MLCVYFIDRVYYFMGVHAVFVLETCLIGQGYDIWYVGHFMSSWTTHIFSLHLAVYNYTTWYMRTSHKNTIILELHAA